MVEDIYNCSGEILAIHDSKELVIKAEILAKSTIGLIQTLKKEAEHHSDSNIQVSFVNISRSEVPMFIKKMQKRSPKISQFFWKNWKKYPEVHPCENQSN